MLKISRRQFLVRSLQLSLGTLVARLMGKSSVGRAYASSAPPALVQAQGLTDTTVQLLWMPVTGAEGYRIYRDGALIASQPGTLFNDAGLAPTSGHSYEVSAIMGGIETDRSSAVATTTQAAGDYTPPTQPGLIKVTNITSGSATLRWAASTDSGGIIGYRILRGDVGAPLSALIQVATVEEKTSYTATHLKAATSYQFAVLALDPSGNLSQPRSITFTTLASSDTTPPDAPSSSSVAVSVFSSSRVDVWWGSSTADDVIGYQVMRNDVQVSEVILPLRKRFSDNGLTPATEHTYKIRAIDSAGNSSPWTTGRNATTLAEGTVKIVRGPYLQWTTANSIRIAWWTNLPAPSSVSYGIGALTEQVSDPVLTRQHVMLIGGLTPSTTYQYMVVSGGATSGALTFNLAASPGMTFAFAAVGDFGGGSGQETIIANLIAAGPTQFVQTVGDNIYPDCEDPDFVTTYSDFDQRFFKPYGPVVKQQTIWFANGNHEYYGNGAFWQNFWMPNNKRWYSYDWGDAHILVLDSEQRYAPGSPQYQFAQADLAANQSKVWRIVVSPRPPYSSLSANSSSESVRTNLGPLFEQQHVQLVLSGNSHNYERTYPLIGGVQSPGGITYIVTGGGGNGISQFLIDQPAWSAFRQASYEYVRVTVSPTSLLVETFLDSGELIDSATIAPYTYYTYLPVVVR